MWHPILYGQGGGSTIGGSSAVSIAEVGVVFALVVAAITRHPIAYAGLIVILPLALLAIGPLETFPNGRSLVQPAIAVTVAWVATMVVLALTYRQTASRTTIRQPVSPDTPTP